MKLKKRFTVEEVLNFDPCEYYTRERIEELFKSVGCKKYMSIKKLFQVDIPINDFFWLILREDFICERTLHEFAIWCAESVIHIYEKYYPDDKRPHEAIRIKKLWIEYKATDEELSAAEAAWAAARAAARAAASAVSAVSENKKEKLKEMII